MLTFPGSLSGLTTEASLETMERGKENDHPVVLGKGQFKKPLGVLLTLPGEMHQFGGLSRRRSLD